MSTRLKRLEMTDHLHEYLQGVSLREDDVQVRLREATLSHPLAVMQISPEQGQFLGLLIEVSGTRRVLEIGTFTGYSALCMALVLPEDGLLVACDVSEEFTAVGKPYWAAAGVAHKIDLRIAPAVDTLDALLTAGEAGRFDFAFIDADKSNYDAYYERALRLVRRGGLIVFDNVLWSGKVADPAVTGDADTEALRALNRKLHTDERISISMLPLADGMTLAVKR